MFLACTALACNNNSGTGNAADHVHPYEDSLNNDVVFQKENDLFLEQFNMRYRKVTVNDGLSQSSIGWFHQDKQGYVWISTADGLNRYDGYSFRVFRNIPGDSTSVGGNKIGLIKEDPFGNIWVGHDHGISYYNPRTEQFTNFSHDDNDPNSITTIGIISSLITDDSNCVWVGGELGFDKLDLLSKKFTHYQSDSSDVNKLPSSFILSAEKTNDTIWIITKKGMCYLDAKSDKITRFSHEPLVSPRFFIDDGKTRYFIAGGNGLFFFNRKDLTYYGVRDHRDSLLWEKYIPDQMYGFEPITKDLFLFGGWFRAAPYLIKDSLASRVTYTPHAYVSNGSASLLNDFSKTLFMGGEGIEMSVANPYNSRFFMFPTIDPWRTNMTTGVWNFAEDGNGHIWIATQNVIFKLDPLTGELHHVNLHPEDSLAKNKNGAFVCFNDDSGNVWIDNQKMFHRYDHKTGLIRRIVYNPNDSIGHPRYNTSAKAKSKDGTFWMSMFTAGICKFNPYTERRTYICGGRPNFNNQAGNAIIRSLCEDDQGRLWAATEEGLDYYDSVKNAFVPMMEHSPYLDYIHSILPQDENHLWLGSQTKGLLRYNIPDQKVIEVYNTSNGLPNDCIYGIERDGKGNLWISTNVGICCFNETTHTTINYTHGDGLQSNEFGGGAHFTDSKGRLYFGGNEGFNIINVDQIRANPFPPRVVISGLKLFNKDVKVSDSLNSIDPTSTTSQVVNLRDGNYVSSHISTLNEIELDYDQNYLTFEFTALHFANPNKNTYEYMMEGLEETWNEAGTRRYATYTSLPHGDYLLRVRAANSDGIKDEQGIALHIIVHPPFWHTWWFRILSGILILTGLYGLYRWKTASLRKRKYELELTVRERTSEVVKQSKEIEKQKDLIQEKNRDITDSINYAKRIQQAILPSAKLFWALFPSSFVLYKPKDIVAGDFYWLERKGDTIFLAVADCTGHGVPGAIVSVVCHNALNRAVHEFGLRNPAEVLNKTRDIVIAEFSKSDEEVRDGMDISLCVFNKTLKGKLEWAGANSPLWLVRDGVLNEFKPDKQPIGKYAEEKSFTAQYIELKSGDQLYMSSDGYADQFGGEKGKKFKTAQFKQLIEQIASLSMNDQMKAVDKSNIDWRGNMEQVDDICVIGVKV